MMGDALVAAWEARMAQLEAEGDHDAADTVREHLRRLRGERKHSGLDVDEQQDRYQRALASREAELRALPPADDAEGLAHHARLRREVVALAEHIARLDRLR